MRSDTNPQPVNRRPAGVFVLGYAMDALREKRITARQAILLAHVDHWLNPFWTRHSEAENDESERFSSRLYWTDYLRSILNATNVTVRAMILDLKSKRPRLLKARKIAFNRWELKTPERDGKKAKQDSVYIPPPVRQGFEAGHLTPMETIFLSRVSSFTRGGKLCYLSNKWFRKFLGKGKRGDVQDARIVQIIKGLSDKGWIISQMLTHDELREVVVEHEGCLPRGFRRRGKRTSRLLWPTDGKLYLKRRWEAAPDGIEWPEEDDDDWDDEVNDELEDDEWDDV